MQKYRVSKRKSRRIATKVSDGRCLLLCRFQKHCIFWQKILESRKKITTSSRSEKRSRSFAIQTGKKASSYSPGAHGSGYQNQHWKDPIWQVVINKNDSNEQRKKETSIIVFKDTFRERGILINFKSQVIIFQEQNSEETYPVSRQNLHVAHISIRFKLVKDWCNRTKFFQGRHL